MHGSYQLQTIDFISLGGFFTEGEVGGKLEFQDKPEN